MKSASELRERIFRCRVPGNCEGCEYNEMELEYLKNHGTDNAVKCCLDWLLDECWHALGEQETRPANIVPYEVLLHSAGRGWEESWNAVEDGDADEGSLMPCVWIDGHIMLSDGCNADARSERWAEMYGRARGLRVWEGDMPPTEEQRKKAIWTDPPEARDVYVPPDPMDGKLSGLITEE